MAHDFFRSAVLILAVVDRPGRKFSGGFGQRHDDLEIFRSCVLVVVCVVVSPETGDKAQPAIQSLSLLPLKIFSRHCVDRHVGLLAQFTLTMSVSSTFTSAVTTDISESVIRKLPFEF